MPDELNDYHWERLLSQEEIKRINKKSYEKYEEVLKFKGLCKFVNSFSPSQGLFGLGGVKKRTREDAINFIANLGMSGDKEKAERFLDEIKNYTFYVFPPIPTGLLDLSYFELTELKNNSETFYKAQFYGDARS